MRSRRPHFSRIIIHSYLPCNKSHFSFQATKIMDTLQTLVTTYGSSNSVAKILSSRDEGVYGWLTVNYLINGKNLAAENQVIITGEKF